MTEQQLDKEDRWLQQQFSAALPELPDQGFSKRVAHRIRVRSMLRTGLPLAAVLAGAAVVVWPAVELLGAFGQQLAFVGQLDWQSLFEANKTIVFGLILGGLSPLAISLLED